MTMWFIGSIMTKVVFRRSAKSCVVLRMCCLQWHSETSQDSDSYSVSVKVRVFICHMSVRQHSYIIRQEHCVKKETQKVLNWPLSEAAQVTCRIMHIRLQRSLSTALSLSQPCQSQPHPHIIGLSCTVIIQLMLLHGFFLEIEELSVLWFSNDIDHQSQVVNERWFQSYAVTSGEASFCELGFWKIRI